VPSTRTAVGVHRWSASGLGMRRRASGEQVLAPMANRGKLVPSPSHACCQDSGARYQSTARGGWSAVEGVLLIHRHGHPHLLLLRDVSETQFRL
jgi:hypothetical protein